MSRIVSFRGLMADDTIDTLPLHTTDGSTGYRIKKFQTMIQNIGVQAVEGLVQIFSISQAAVPTTIDFGDQTLLAAAYYAQETTPAYAVSNVAIFDNMTFNQDIYICYKDLSTGQPMNYYIELEQVSLDLNENTVATLKDIRNIARTV